MNASSNNDPCSSEDPTSKKSAVSTLEPELPSKYENTDFYLSRTMAVEEVRESAERLKAEFLEQMEEKLSAVINDVVHTMQKVDTVDRYKNLASSPISTNHHQQHPHNSSTSALITSPTSSPFASHNYLSSTQENRKRDSISINSSPNNSNRSSRRLSVSGKLPEKVFISRPSPLTELLQVTHFKTIHHIFIATLILIMLHNIILDLVERNAVDLGFVRLMWAFGQPQLTLGILLALEFCGLVVLYPAFHFWSRARSRVKSEFRQIIDHTAALVFLLFLSGMIYVPAAIMWNNPLPPASGATVTMEQCRLLMKIYAFVRSNVPRVLRSTATNTTGNSTFSSSKKSRKSSSESVDENESNSPSTTTTYSPENSIWKQKEGKVCNLGDDDAAGGVSQVSSSSAENNGGNQEETLDKKKKNLEGGGGGGDGGDNDVGDGTIAGTWTPKATTTSGDFQPTSLETQSKLRRRINGINGKSKISFGGGVEEEREKFKEADDNVDELSPTPTKLGGSCDISSENNNNLNGGLWSSSSSSAAATTTICPSYSKYLYFYVAPTLIYKDNYPRTSFVRWDYVCWNFAQVFGCIVYANFILSRYATSFVNFGRPDHPMTVLQFCNAVFSMMLPGILGLVLGFYLLLHSWHNAFAEMLCFGDRLFYKGDLISDKLIRYMAIPTAFLQYLPNGFWWLYLEDFVRGGFTASYFKEDWWNGSSFHSYYKTWNILVHDWLYTYIFKDAWEIGLAKYNKAIPTILVFLVSSLFHEYVLSFSFNFFFPVLLTLFGGFGLALTFLRNSENVGGNIFMWFGLISGSGILVSTYTMEFYARINCPDRQQDDMADFFTPRFWTCNAIVWK